MKYKLRHFENNLQIVSSLGWILIIIGIIIFFTGPIPAGALSLLIGFLLVWFQYRGKTITVDTEAKNVKSGGNSIEISNPSMVYMNEVKVSQNVNSRGSSANVKMYFYKAYIQDGENSILISCNRNDQRDIKAIAAIANDLGVPFKQNYE